MSESERKAIRNPRCVVVWGIREVAQRFLKETPGRGASCQTITVLYSGNATLWRSLQRVSRVLFFVVALLSQTSISAAAEKIETPREIAKSLYELRFDRSIPAQKKMRELTARLESIFPKRAVAYRATFHTTIEDCCFDPSYALEILELDARAGNSRSSAVLGLFLNSYLPSLAAGARLAAYPDARRKIALPENAKQKGGALIVDASAKRDPLALYLRGSDCINGADAKCSRMEGYQLLESAANLGYSLAALFRGAIALQYDGDLDTAKRWAERGMELGNPEASWLMYKLYSADSKLADAQKESLLLRHLQVAAFGCFPEAEVALTRIYLDLKESQVDALRTAIVTWGLISKGRGRKWADEVFAKASATQVPESAVKNVNAQFPCPPPFWLQ